MSKFNIVKRYIDYYGLLSGGAPDDEFDNESRAIAGLISTESTVEEISNVIAKIFQSTFGNKENATDYINVATGIRSELSGERR